MNLDEIKDLLTETKKLLIEVREENRSMYLSLIEQQKQNTEFSQSLCRMLKATRSEINFNKLIQKAGETIALANSQTSIKPNGEIKPENKDILPEVREESVVEEQVKPVEQVEQEDNSKLPLKNFFEEIWKNGDTLLVHGGNNLTAKQLCPASLKNRIAQDGESDIFQMLSELTDPAAKKYMQILVNKYQEQIK